MVLLGVDITTEFLRIILTGKIRIEATILFFIRIERNSNTVCVLSLLRIGCSCNRLQEFVWRNNRSVQLLQKVVETKINRIMINTKTPTLVK